MKIKPLIVGVIETNTYFVADDKTGNAVVIDPAADAEKILRTAKENDFTIKKILLTHGHFDHIGAVTEIAEKTGAEIYISEEDVELLRDARKNSSLLFFGIEVHCDLPVTTVRDSDTISLDSLSFTVKATPGHTNGSVCYFIGKAVFTGDTLFRDGYGRTDLYGGDRDKLRVSLMALASLAQGKKLYPGHGPMASTFRA